METIVQLHDGDCVIVPPVYGDRALAHMHGVKSVQTVQPTTTVQETTIIIHAQPAVGTDMSVGVMHIILFVNSLLDVNHIQKT